MGDDTISTGTSNSFLRCSYRMPQSVRDLDIFKDTITTSTSKETLIKPWSLYVESAFEPASKNYRVISISLFIFPGRVHNSNVAVYRHNIAEYLAGIAGSLRYVQECLPRWAVRLHVDYSIPLSSRLKGLKHEAIRALANELLDDILRLQTQFGDIFQIVGVRRKFPKGKERYTMFPAMYRFLPLFDTNVEMVMSSEADNPYNSLYHYFAETEWLKKDNLNKYMFIIPDSYDIEHCLVYIATHRHVMKPQLCPCMIWGGKRTAGSLTIEDPGKFTEMLSTQQDPAIQFLFNNIDAIKQLALPISAELSKKDQIKNLQRARSFEDIYDMLYKAAQSALNLLDLEKVSATLQKIVDVCQKDADLLSMVVYMNFSTILSRFVPAAKWVAHFNFLDRVVPAVLNEAYGVDEWLVRILFDSAVRDGSATIVSTSSPEYGLRFQDRRSLQNDDPGNTLRLLNDIQGGNWPPYGEAVARSVTFLRLLWPLSAPRQVEQKFRQIKNDYYKRLYYMGDCLLQAADIQYDTFYKVLDHMFYNEGFFGQAGRHVMQIVDSSRYSKFLSKYHITYDAKQRRYSFKDTCGYEQLKGVLLKGCLLDMKMLHMFKICKNPLAQTLKW